MADGIDPENIIEDSNLKNIEEMDAKVEQSLDFSTVSVSSKGKKVLKINRSQIKLNNEKPESTSNKLRLKIQQRLDDQMKAKLSQQYEETLQKQQADIETAQQEHSA